MLYQMSGILRRACLPCTFQKFQNRFLSFNAGITQGLGFIVDCFSFFQTGVWRNKF